MMTKQRKNVGVTARVMEPLLTVPDPRAVSQRTAPISSTVPAQSKYVKLLRAIEQLGRDLKLCYTGDNIQKTLPRVERDIAKACCLVQQCRAEATKSARKSCQWYATCSPWRLRDVARVENSLFFFSLFFLFVTMQVAMQVYTFRIIVLIASKIVSSTVFCSVLKTNMLRAHSKFLVAC